MKRRLLCCPAIGILILTLLAGCVAPVPAPAAPGGEAPAAQMAEPVVHPCTTEIASPSEPEPEELVRLVADPTGDFVLDHPLFTEVYEVVFEDNGSIPPALDIVQVEVLSEDGIHTIQIRTQEEGSVIQEMGRDDQRVSFGIYIDTDRNGVSDYLLTTTDSPERGVIVTPEFEFVAEMPRLGFDDSVVSMQVPEEIVGARFDWLVFSGYSPKAEAFHPTALDNVFFVPQIDVVPSVAGMTGVITFYAGPGSCQVIDSRSSMRCPVISGTPTTTIPGTSIQGKLWYRKLCGTTEAAFWCVGAGFGARVSGGVTTGWVGKCPYPCGGNWIDAWDTNNDGSLDKVWHTVRDADCSAPSNPLKHFDSDSDQKIDSMSHTYLYASDELESCNLERDVNTGSLVEKRCCPKRPPYANKGDVPPDDPTVGIVGSSPDFNCPISAP